MQDLIIIGGGPAGLTAALYAKRAGLNVVIFEKFAIGGQVSTTYEIENYPGFLNISGPDLIAKMEEQVTSIDVKIISEEVISIEEFNGIKKVTTKQGEYNSKTIILALGAKPKLLDVTGENEFMGKGVSYCATCDGNFFRKKDVAVVGGGNTAVEDAIFLSRICNKVYLIHRRDTFRADKKLVDSMLKIDNVEIIYDTITEEIIGENLVTGVRIKNIKTAEIKTLEVKGIFVAVGVKPNNEIAKHLVELDETGFILTKEDMSTKTKGIFAAGDGRNTPIRQIVVAASDGAIAAYSALGYIAIT
jgi:thioredoxin reductase (NADPH)